MKNHADCNSATPDNKLSIGIITYIDAAYFVPVNSLQIICKFFFGNASEILRQSTRKNYIIVVVLFIL